MTFLLPDAPPRWKDRLLGLIPWLLLPFSIYVILLPLFESGRALGPVAVAGVVGGLAVAGPAVVLAAIERRVSRRAARLVLLALFASAAVALAASAQVLGALAAALALTAAAYGYGRTLLTRCVGERADVGWRQVPFEIAVGWTVILIIGLAAGAGGLLVMPVVALTGLVGVVLAVWIAGASWSSSTDDDAHEAPALFWWWGFGLLVLIGLVGALAPEVRHDALAAHLPIAAEFAARRGIVEIPHNAASYFQLHGDLLYAMSTTLVPGAALPKLLHFLAGAGATLIVYDLGTRLWNARVGLAAAAIFAGTPLVWWLAGTAYTDLWVALFAAASINALERHRRRPRPGTAFIIGLLVGAAVGVKITGLIVALPVTLLALHTSLSRSTGRRWLIVLAMIGGGLLTGAYWYGRAWWLTGNPVFPLLGQTITGRYGGPLYARLAPVSFGMGRGPLDLVLLPWRITRFPERFVEDGGLGVVYLALVPAVLVAARRHVPGWVLVLAGGAAVSWIATAQYLRFLVPALPVFALVAAGSWFGVRLHGPVLRGVHRLTPAVVIAGLLALAAGTWITPGAPNFPISVVLGRTARQDYLARYVPGFRMIDFARRSLPPGARIFSAGNDWVFYYDRFLVSLSWYGRIYTGDLRAALVSAASGVEVQRLLVQRGFTHLVLHAESVPFVGRRNPNAWIVREGPWEEGPRLEFASDGFYLFTLDPSAHPRGAGRALFRDSVRVNGPEPFVSSPIAAVPGGLYAFEATVRSDAQPDTAWMRVEWRARDGRLLDAPASRQVPVGARATRRALASTAPPGADAAVVTVAASGSAAIEADVRFHELR